jgi:peroxiredoxin
MTTASRNDSDEVASPLIGRRAPGFSLRDLAGHKVRLADYRGKAVLINFWATWCTPCQVEMPWFVDLQGKYASQGFTVLGIDKDYPEDLPKVPGFAKKMGLNYPVLYGDGTTYDAYGCCEYLPMSYYVDREGTVRMATIGLSDREAVEANIRRLLRSASPAPDRRLTAAATAPVAPALSEK